jgi:glycosyltransferase involved in cell wall biosynthesis
MNNKIRVVHMVRRVGPTSMPWNDLYYSVRFLAPGISHIPIAVTRVFGWQFCKWIKCNNRTYRYVDSSMLSSVYRVHRIYLKNLRRDVKTIVHIHNPSLFVIALLIKVFCPKVIIAVNLHNDWKFFKIHQKIGLHILARISDYFITVSYAIKSSIPNRCIKKLLTNNKLSSIPNGIRLEDFSNYSNGPRNKVMVIVARMVPQKNCFFAIDILSKSKCVEKLIWIGNGVQRESILQYAEELGVAPKLELMGVISRKQVYDVLNNSSIYIAPSKWEGIGVANLEAAALGCIPFLSDIPPHQEIATNINIKTYSLEESESWANDIDYILGVPFEEDCHKRDEISRMTMKKYNLDNAIQKYIEIYNKDLKSPIGDQ